MQRHLLKLLGLFNEDEDGHAVDNAYSAEESSCETPVVKVFYGIYYPNDPERDTTDGGKTYFYS